MQTTFERLLSRTGVRNIAALAYQIVDGLLVDEYRARSARQGQEQVSWETVIGPLGEGLDHLPQFQTLDFEGLEFADGHDAAVRDLDPDLRDAYIVGELRGLTSREAEPVLGVSRTTAAARRELATTSIREELLA